MKGKIHSIETFGTVDGPGIRYVVFLQGCPMRCKYCHNPDTWLMSGGTERDSSELLDDYESYRPFLKNGGLTVTGGEPLMQLDFLIELFESAKERNIHTCIDTSGVTFQPDNIIYLEKLDRLLAVTDLVMLDIKHIDSDAHASLTGVPNENILAFADYLNKLDIPVWIRHVVVPGITYKEDPLYRLGYFIGSLSNVKALDILPYHTMGTSKYAELGIDYPLKGTDPLDKQDAVKAKEIILEGIRDCRSSKNTKR